MAVPPIGTMVLVNTGSMWMPAVVLVTRDSWVTGCSYPRPDVDEIVAAMIEDGNGAYGDIKEGTGPWDFKLM